jgi:carboxylesterase
MNQENNKDLSFYLKAGDKGILLIHGITGTPSEMGYLGKSLNKSGFSVLCNTLPGHCSTLNELKKVTWQQIAEACSRGLQVLKKDCRQVFVGGLSMGALMSVHLAKLYPDDISGIIALAPTIFYDGWALHKGKVLMEMTWHIPLLRNLINIREGWPYGLKDERARALIERFYKKANSWFIDNNKVLLFGSPFFPVASLYEHHRFTKVVMEEIPRVDKPILIIHAREDDMTSLKNAEHLLNNIASKDKTLLVLEDSYHMITIDKEKEKVAKAAADFMNRIN